MTGTMAWLESSKSVSAGLSMVVEGLSTAFATDAMTGTYSADIAPYSAWGDPIGGLMAEGTISQAIELYAQDIEADTLRFTVVDKQGVLAGSLMREAYSSGHRTYLTANLLAGQDHTVGSGAGIIAVKDTTGFASAGTLYIGEEAITYTGKTGTTFTGCTRARFVINQTSSGAAFAPSHLISNNVIVSTVTAPAVSDFPRSWIGRFVHLFFHYRDPLTGAFNVPSQATKVWSGRIVDYGDKGDGRISITAKSAIELLNRAVGNAQWSGRINEGIVLSSAKSTLVAVNTKTPSYGATTTLGWSGRMSHADVAASINAQFDAWNTAVTTRAGDLWELELVDNGDGGPPRYRFRLHANSTAVSPPDMIRVCLHKDAWDLLGWDATAPGEVVTAAYNYVIERDLHLVTSSPSVWELRAPKAPIIYYFTELGPLATYTVSDQVGTFSTQNASELDSTPQANGVVQLKGGGYDAIFAVKFTAGSPDATIINQGLLSKDTGRFLYAGYQDAHSTPNGAVRMGDVTEAPTVRQVWFGKGAAGTVLLKALLSTGGTSGYNDSVYDTFTASGFGAAVPASLVDTYSWSLLNDVQLLMLVTDPKPFYELLEPVLAVTNRYVVWKARSASANPALCIVRPTLDNANAIDWALTESNKCFPDERAQVMRAADGIINRVVVKYGNGLTANNGFVTGFGDPIETIVVEDLASQTDYGRRRTVTIEAPNIANVPALIPATIGTALGYFSRPLAILKRSYNASLARMAPGDSVSVTDNYMIDPQTGTRGAIVYGWVLSTSFDLATGQGHADIVFLPEKFPRVAKYAPSARVDETAAGAGYASFTKTLTFRQNEYSLSVETNDAQQFVAGDKVHIYSLDEASPLEWFDTILTTPTATTARLIIGLVGFDTTKQYVMEYDDVLTVGTTQRLRAFVADDADLSTGAAISTPYDWGSQGPVRDGTASVDFTQGVRTPNSTEAGKGEPVSVHQLVHAARGANCLNAYGLRTVHMNSYFEAAATQTGTTPKLVVMQWIPLYGHAGSDGNRGLVCRVYGKQAGGGTATVTVYASPTMPTGASFTTHRFALGTNSVTFTTTSATPVWSGELSLTPGVSPAIGSPLLRGTWIAAEISGSAGGVTATLNAIFVCEDILS